MDKVNSVHLFLRHKAKDRMCDDFGPHTHQLPTYKRARNQESQTFWDGVKCILAFYFFIESKRDYKTLWPSCSI